LKEDTIGKNVKVREEQEKSVKAKEKVCDSN
jgi:hypothetical protein